ncbi:NAD(P)-binding protein [Xylaria palmicola]|nr:NAD(P)-binding protein [Xylaria palmicola]
MSDEFFRSRKFSAVNTHWRVKHHPRSLVVCTRAVTKTWLLDRYTTFEVGQDKPVQVPMGAWFSKNDFPVEGRTVVITGGSSGMGLAVGSKLAEMGANVVIVARNRDKLASAIQQIQKCARDGEAQRFHQVSADLMTESESVRVIDEVTLWNAGNPPDIVWCCAGSPHIALFVETPASEFASQMDSNYFTSLYMAHATLRRWLGITSTTTTAEHRTYDAAAAATAPKATGPRPPARHLIFTASFLAFYSFAGYAPYSPCKAALRALCDNLSQEMNLYNAASPAEPAVRVHTVFPSGIHGPSFDLENRMKCDLTKVLESTDGGQPAAVVAAKSIRGLERGEELVTTEFLSYMVKRGMLGGSVRGGVLRVLWDWLLVSLMGVIMVFVRDDMDRKTRAWGRRYGPTGHKGRSKQA